MDTVKEKVEEAIANVEEKLGVNQEEAEADAQKVAAEIETEAVTEEPVIEQAICSACEGRGFIDEFSNKCTACSGTGKVN